MLFKYTAIDKTGNETAGSIDTINKDVAISSLQRQGLVISSIISAEEKSFFKREISFFDRVSNKEIVMLSRQISTLFESQVSALRVFKLLGSESSNKILRAALIDVADDIQSGKSISDALSEHNKIFSPFYVNMVRAGEESGKLDQIFSYLANLYKKLYLSRISDNLSTMLSSGITMTRAIEITATVIGDTTYEKLLNKSAQSIKSGSSLSESFTGHKEIPSILIQMVKVGEETGELSNILNTLSKFYAREIKNTVDTLVTLIEPIMIVALALGVGVLLAAVLMPIYNISSAI